MKQLKILHTREIKRIIEIINKQWGCDLKKDLSGYVVLLSTKDKIYLLSRDFANVDDRNLNIDSAGMYFGEVLENNSMRLSIEGSQLVGPFAQKNAVELDDDESRSWLAGNDIEKDTDAAGFVLLKNRNRETGRYDFLGCGKCRREGIGEGAGKNIGKKAMEKSRILNYVPKTRRISGQI